MQEKYDLLLVPVSTQTVAFLINWNLSGSFRKAC